MADIAERSATVVELERVAVAGELASGDVRDVRRVERLRGALAALEWATGRRPQAPVSAKLIEHPVVGVISDESTWAYEVVVGVRPATAERGRDYAGGVEEALRWLLGSDSAPVPTDEITNLSDTSPAALRSGRDIDDMHAMALGAKASPPDYADDEMVLWTSGTIDALDWLRGRRPTCPVTNTEAPVSAESVETAATRYAALVGSLSAVDQAYGYGVHLTLSWALRLAEEAPLP